MICDSSSLASISSFPLSPRTCILSLSLPHSLFWIVPLKSLKSFWFFGLIVIYGKNHDNDDNIIPIYIVGSWTSNARTSIVNRYIEIFRSSLSEVRASIGPKMRGGPMGGFNQRPAPYTRGDRFGGMNRFSNNGRGSRNRGDYCFVTSEFRSFEI